MDLRPRLKMALGFLLLLARFATMLAVVSPSPRSWQIRAWLHQVILHRSTSTDLLVPGDLAGKRWASHFPTRAFHFAPIFDNQKLRIPCERITSKLKPEIVGALGERWAFHVSIVAQSFNHMDGHITLTYLPPEFAPITDLFHYAWRRLHDIDSETFDHFVGDFC